MKKAVVCGLLILATGFILWQLIAGAFFNPAQELGMRVNKEKFDWFQCPSCSRLFMAEATTRKACCPYCGSQMMLVSEAKRVVGTRVNESDFVCFFSPQCGNVFFAFQTGEMGKCPYCGEILDLTAPETPVFEKKPTLLAWTQLHFGKLLLGALGLFAISIAGIYILLEKRIILLLKPVEGTVSGKTEIELSKWKARKKKVTLGGTPDHDIILKDPSLKDIHCTFSFVRVGGNTHAYLSQGANQPVWINEKLKYNPRLHDQDKIKLGDVIFEVRTKRK